MYFLAFMLLSRHYWLLWVHEYNSRTRQECWLHRQMVDLSLCIFFYAFQAFRGLMKTASAANPVKLRYKLGLEISNCNQWLPPGVPMKLGELLELRLTTTLTNPCFQKLLMRKTS